MDGRRVMSRFSFTKWGTPWSPDPMARILDHALQLWRTGLRIAAHGRHEELHRITLAGPMAGFLFAGVIVAVIIANATPNQFLRLLMAGATRSRTTMSGRSSFNCFVTSFGTGDLLPVLSFGWRTDFRCSLFQAVNPREGAARRLWLSVIVGATVAAASSFCGMIFPRALLRLYGLQ